jgi:hypothetical protein
MTTATLTGLPAGVRPAGPVTRIRVLTGEDDDSARRGAKTVIARSDCRYYCPDAATAARCIQALRESDERLRSRPEEMMLWDWGSTYYEKDPGNPAGGGTVLLGVAWYDLEFYRDRREAWLGAMHKRAYARIGVALEDITVTHWVLDPVS